MNVKIIVPWRGGDPDREAALACVLQHYAPLGWPISLVDSGHDPFSRGHTQNLGASQVEPWDVLVVLDADCLVSLPVIRRAVRVSDRESAVVLPHDRYVPLTVEQTAVVLAGEKPDLPPAAGRARPARITGDGARGGLHIISKGAWARIGGYDPVKPRGQDTRLLEAATHIGVPVLRMPGPIVHLHHDRPDKMSDQRVFMQAVAEIAGAGVKPGTRKWHAARQEYNLRLAAGRLQE